MFAKLVNEIMNPDSDLRSGRVFWLKHKKKQELVQVAAPLDPSTQTMETMKDSPVQVVNVVTESTEATEATEATETTESTESTGSAKCTCGVHTPEDETLYERELHEKVVHEEA